MVSVFVLVASLPVFPCSCCFLVVVIIVVSVIVYDVSVGRGILLVTSVTNTVPT